ncbi:class II fructose-1,6-bisphosphate aldolase [Desulfovirgula thermocuniculi]|uniref:class II fructose-1,6-bisphosphate aldolase n=1 Tax=Desulfovirgula thermocuniculi TaxID=348842 RepID=UPI0003FAA630|nr:class II fructose-1,6-bisphosphate aldolase [Desulfovirgula thermocuniculi]
MPFVPVGVLLRDAEEQGYAVGAFNCNNMELVQAIVAAAEAERSPVILQASQGAIKYAGLAYLVAMARAAARGVRVPVALHLDHGTSFEQAVRCVAAGFSSVMIDGSHLPLEENIALTRRVVEVARAAGVSVEGELGRIMGAEDEIKVEEREAFFTDPAEARYFVERTGVDSLAVSVGTAHGRYQGEPRLDFERLSRIKELVRVPLVLHGASGVPEEAIREAVRRGVRKINIDTEIREAFVGALRRELGAHPQEIDPRKILGPAREAAVEVIRAKMRLFGCAGKARV